MTHEVNTNGFSAEIHVYGPMASGKTHFTREIEAILKRMREEVPGRTITVRVTESNHSPAQFNSLRRNI